MHAIDSIRKIHQQTFGLLPNYLLDDNCDKAIPYFETNPQIFSHEFDSGKNILMILIEKQAFKIARWLITNRKLDLAACDTNGHNAVYYACQSGNLALAEVALHYGQDLEKKSLDFQEGTNSVLHQAAECQNGCQGSCLEQLVTYPIDLSVTDHNGKTALERAVSCRMITTAAILLNAGANPKIGNPPPIVEAYLHNDFEMCSLLLKKGASPNVFCLKQSLLHLAYAAAKEDFVELFLRFGAEQDDFFQDMREFDAIVSGQSVPKQSSTETIDSRNLHELVLDSSIKPTRLQFFSPEDWSVKNHAGDTPFIHCCKHGNLSLLYNVNRSYFKQEINSGLLVALQVNQFANALTLLDMGANPLIVDSNQNTLLHILSSKEKIDELEFSQLVELKKLITHLVEKGINIETKNSQKKTALFKAIETGNVFVTSQLVQLNANRTDSAYLVTACKARSIEITKLLLNKQIGDKIPADPNQSHDEQNPLFISLKNITSVSSMKEQDLLETAEYQLFDTLIRAGAKTTIKAKATSRKKITPIALAAELKLPGVVLMRLEGKKPPVSVSPLTSLEDLSRSVSPMPGATSAGSSVASSPHSPQSIDSRSHSPNLSIGSLAISENKK